MLRLVKSSAYMHYSCTRAHLGTIDYRSVLEGLWRGSDGVHTAEVEPLGVAKAESKAIGSVGKPCTGTEDDAVYGMGGPSAPKGSRMPPGWS